MVIIAIINNLLFYHWNNNGIAFFVDDKGKRLYLKGMEVDILDRITAIQSKHPELIGVRVDVYEEYRLSRSFWRGSNLEALNRGMKEKVIDRKKSMEDQRKSGSKEGEIKDAASLYGCDYCIKKLYEIFTGLVIEDGFKKGIFDDSGWI